MGKANKQAQNNKWSKMGLESNLVLAMNSRIWIRSKQIAKYSWEICYEYPVCADEIVHTFLLDLLEEPI
jgi:hypothetical protein